MGINTYQNYKIIHNEVALRNFIDNFLPDIDDNTHTYYVSLLARNKYEVNTNVIKGDKAQVKRFNSSKERLFDKIKQLEVPLGSYKTSDGEIIPQEALVLYIAPNPKSLRKATFLAQQQLTESLYNGKSVNPRQVGMAAIHNAYDKFYFRDFDMDNVSADVVVNDVSQFINHDAVHFLQTRGGVHVIVESAKVISEYKKTWFKNIFDLPYTDKNASSGKNKNSEAKDFMIPVVGGTQNNFSPYLL